MSKSDHLEEIKAEELSLQFQSFTADTAWTLGLIIRDSLRADHSTPTVINIALANSQQILFHACSRPGTTSDNDIWVTRKRRTVLRFGCSSYYMHHKFQGDEKAFADKYALGSTAGEYAIHGGGVPIRVRGVEGIVAIVTVSGLSQEQDHMAVVSGIKDCMAKSE